MLLEKSTEQRIQMYLNKEHHPGLVILGEKGIGKRLMAEMIAMKLLNIGELNLSPDYLVVESSGGSILIDQLEKIKLRSAYYAVNGDYKVFIIDDADTMNRHTQNALLKLLEDGNATNIFIFVAHKPLLNTIHSRCEVIRAIPPTFDEFNDYLKANNQVIDEIIMKIASNRIGLYQHMMADTSFVDDCKRIFNQFLTMQKKRDLLTAFGLVKEKDPKCFYEHSNDKVKMFYNFMKGIFVDVLYSLAGIPTKEDYSNIKIHYGSKECIHVIRMIEQHLEKIETKGLYTKDDFFDLIRYMVV